MKLLKLTTGEFTKVDDDIYEIIKNFNWRRDKTTLHVVRTIGPKKKRRLLRLHRLVMNVTESNVLVDHVNGDTLDNQRSNLRLADKSTNGMNRPKQQNNTSGFKGVTYLINAAIDVYISKTGKLPNELLVGSMLLTSEPPILQNMKGFYHLHGYVPITIVSGNTIEAL